MCNVAVSICTGSSSNSQMLMDEFKAIITSPKLSVNDLSRMSDILHEEYTRRKNEQEIQKLVADGWSKEEATTFVFSKMGRSGIRGTDNRP